MKILLVEDQADVAKSTSILLGVLGHEVTLARNGRQAIDLSQTFVADVAIIDMGLPDLSGLEVGAKIRELPTWDGSVVIALTGYDYQEECYRFGFDYFQNKPMDFKTLPSIVSLGRRRNDTGGRSSHDDSAPTTSSSQHKEKNDGELRTSD